MDADREVYRIIESDIDQFFSTDGPRPSGGPQRSFGGPLKLSCHV